MKNRRNIYETVASLRPGRSVFDLSYEKKFTCDMGQVIPIMCDEMVPGDKFMVGCKSVVRCQPLVAPILHEVDVYEYFIFVPYRLLWNEKTNEETEDEGTWEEFITGGQDGDATPTLPRWVPILADTAIGSLWDYLGFPTDAVPDYFYPIDFPRRAYNLIWNTFIRSEDLQDEIGLDNNEILNCCWGKDYFTSALPWQQRGTAPALPISGTTSAVWPTSAFSLSGELTGFLTANGSSSDNVFHIDNNTTTRDNFIGALGDNEVDLSVASTFDIADLRLAFQIQRFLERNARAGARYTEFLKSHFGISPRDERLQRPEFVGGARIPLIFSEVLQTSETSVTAQGNLAGHGIAVDTKYCGKYTASEFGLMMGLMFIRPKSQYQQGINRQWMRTTKYDFYFPEFANLSEQAVYNGEICVVNGDGNHNLTIFGYQGRYDEMRTKQNLTCGHLRDDFDFWHLGRIFDEMSPPSLNADFVECVPSKRVFAVTEEPGLVVSVANIIKAVRPMPITAEPGLIDH